MATLATGAFILSSVVGLGTSLYAQSAANNAAEAAANSQTNALNRQKENQRQTLIENSKRQLRNKERQLAQLRASQAASGFNTSSGTPLAIFGDIESRLDEQINEGTSQALDAIGNTQNQINNVAYGEDLRRQASGVNTAAIFVGAATKFGSGYASNYDRTGNDPFSVFS